MRIAFTDFVISPVVNRTVRWSSGVVEITPGNDLQNRGNVSHVGEWADAGQATKRKRSDVARDAAVAAHHRGMPQSAPGCGWSAGCRTEDATGRARAPRQPTRRWLSGTRSSATGFFHHAVWRNSRWSCHGKFVAMVCPG